MPSREQLALRKSAAFDRLNRTLVALADRLGIDAGAVDVAPVKDPDLAAVIGIEQMADALDAIAAAIPAAKPTRAVKQESTA